MSMFRQFGWLEVTNFLKYFQILNFFLLNCGFNAIIARERLAKHVILHRGVLTSVVYNFQGLQSLVSLGPAP